jgi:hypothetical protein
MLQIGEISDNIDYIRLLQKDVSTIQRDMTSTVDETEATIGKMVHELGHISHEDGQVMARTLLRLYVLLGTHPNSEGINRARVRIKSLFEELR